MWMNLNGKKKLGICLPGIRAKFYQNPMAMDTLLYKTGNKKIVECASDCLWGNGMPLGDPACLDSTKWISQGILGQMLECICSEVTQPRAQSYHQLPPLFTSSLAYKVFPWTHRNQTIV